MRLICVFSLNNAILTLWKLWCDFIPDNTVHKWLLLIIELPICLPHCCKCLFWECGRVAWRIARQRSWLWRSLECKRTLDRELCRWLQSLKSPCIDRTSPNYEHLLNQQYTLWHCCLTWKPYWSVAPLDRPDIHRIDRRRSSPWKPHTGKTHSRHHRH